MIRNNDVSGSVVEYAGIPVRLAAVDDQPPPGVPHGWVEDDPRYRKTWLELRPRITTVLTVLLFFGVPYGWQIWKIMHGAEQ